MSGKDLYHLSLSKAQLIEASAGTGKTYNLTELYVRLILEKELAVDQILVVTYTDAATEELRHRIRTRLRDKKISLAGSGPLPDTDKKKRLLNEALANFDEAAIFTIHGFCYRVLKEQAFESGALFDSELITNQDHLLRETVDDFWRKHFFDISPEFADYCLDKKISVESFHNLVSGHLQNPLLKIIPDISDPEMDGEMGILARVYRKTAAVWRGSQKDIEKLITAPGRMNQRQYRAEAIPGWIAAFDLFFSHEAPPAAFPEQLAKLIPNALERGTNNGHHPPQHDFFPVCEELLSAYDALFSCFEKKLIFLQKTLFPFTRESLKEKKTFHNVLYFDDLLLEVYHTLGKDRDNRFADSIRKKYRAALIDEFQDTDPVQYRIFSDLFIHPDTGLFLIGDPKQAIYSFRNADLFAYLKAAEKTGKSLTLSTNWRADPALIKAVNFLFEDHDNPFLFSDIKYVPVKPPKEGKDRLLINRRTEPPLQLWYVPANKKPRSASKINKPVLRKNIAAAVASEIARLLKLSASGKARISGKPLGPEDIAVLVRTNDQAATIQDSLKKSRIPSILYNTGNIFATDDAVQMIYVLNALATPGDEKKIKAALATDLLGIKEKQLINTVPDSAFLTSEMDDFRKYRDLGNASGFFPMFQQFLVEKEVKSRLISLPEGERKLTNILHLAELIHHYLLQENLGLSAAAKWLTEQHTREDRQQEEEQLRLESDRNTVKIVTIHKSKGLEYPIVFCPYLWDGLSKTRNAPALFHDHDKNLLLDLGSDHIEENRQLANHETLSESIRLLYVALTRARHRCYLVWGGAKGAGTSPLAYLFHHRRCQDPEKAVQETENRFMAMGDDDILKTLLSLEKNSGQTIHVQHIDHTCSRPTPPPDTEIDTALCCRKFQGSVSRDFAFTSFSSLISGRRPDSGLPESDEFHYDPSGATPGEDLSIFNFPAGAVPGTMLHEILEHLDFTTAENSDINRLVRDKLVRYGFDQKWISVIGRQIKTLLSVPLMSEDGDFSLSRLQNADRLNEMEFYFPVKRLSKKRLGTLFRDTAGAAPAGFPEEIDKLTFSPLNGYLKGFMDLVFRYRNKFYIVDWKSNLLGKTLDDYCAENLTPVMQRDYYILQYHLYTLALHKYLKHRLPDYDYEKYFGGIFYVFLRGIAGAKSPDHGIYRDRPQKAFILEMERTLTGS